MPGPLAHSPAYVLQKLLIAIGQGTEPSLGAAWPIYVSAETKSPDAQLVVFNTAGTLGGRDAPTAEMAEHNGISILVRAGTNKIGYAKARILALALDALYQRIVDVEDVGYKVHSFTRTSDVLDLGKATPDSKLSLFTVNGLLSLRER